MAETSGNVFNIQSYAIHDGPGIRTTVFMKGCPLRCSWCQNPESQAFAPELFFNRDRCTGCGACVPACPRQAVSLVDGVSRTDRSRCNGAGHCVEVCPNEARMLMGSSMSVDDVFAKVRADRAFYERSGGGVTVSGGEPTGQPGFVKELLSRCKEAGIHTALDTCGFAGRDVLDEILDGTDLVLFDLKHMGPAEHKKHTGVSNELILDNARHIYHTRRIPMLVRVPVVPGINDSDENMTATARFVAEQLGADVPVHLLPYHNLGDTKRERLEQKEYSPGIEPPGEARMQRVKLVFEQLGLTVHRGG